jgi:hypothetical protein
LTLRASSFINSPLGERVCPVKACPTTSSITRFGYGPEHRVLLHEEGAEVPVSISSERYRELVCHAAGPGETPRYRFELRYPFETLRHVHLFDTPGFNNPKNPYDTEMTRSVAAEADVLFMVMDINRGELTDDARQSLGSVRLLYQRGGNLGYGLGTSADNRGEVTEDRGQGHKIEFASRFGS